MSVVANYIGSLIRPEFFTFSDTDTETIYTVNDTTPGLSLASAGFVNLSGSPVQCTLYVYDGSTEWPVYTENVASNATGIYRDNPTRLLPGYEVRAKANASVTLKINLISQLQQRGV